MSLKIKIHNYEGPFDLLLHLINKNEMNIYDININEITEQYLEVINEMDELDLEVTSEFIVIAATLIEIKSKQLLPKNTDDNDENAVDEIDSSKRLIDKLIEYRKFKAAAQYLSLRQIENGISYAKKPEIIEEETVSMDEFFKGKSIVDLYNIFLGLMNIYISKQNKGNIALQKKMYMDTVKIEDKMEEIDSILYENKNTVFSNIIDKCSTKIEKIITFLALLELVRLKKVSAVQEDNFNEIYIKRLDQNEEY
jgi:segregation and condensation protein A